MNIRRARPSESEELSALAGSAKALWGYSAQQLALWSGVLRISPESIVSEPTFVAEEYARLVGVAQPPLQHASRVMTQHMFGRI